MAVPLFIFAATVCRFVGELSGNPLRRLEDILQYETEDVSKLGMTYLPILSSLFTIQNGKEKIKFSREFQEIVGSIVILESPLSIKSLASLLGKSKYDISCRLDSLHSVLSIPNRDDAPVRLLHQSFREFLVDTSNEKSPFWVDEIGTHKGLASRCLMLMSKPSGLYYNMCILSGPGILRSEIDEVSIASNLPPELQYACHYWVKHLKQSQRNITNGDATHIFLQKHLLYWFEAMSLMRESSKCVQLLDSLQALVAVRSLNSSLVLS